MPNPYGNPLPTGNPAWGYGNGTPLDPSQYPNQPAPINYGNGYSVPSPITNPNVGPGSGSVASAGSGGNPSDPSNITGSASAAGNLVGGAIGAFEYFNAQKALKQLNAQKSPNYTVGAELQNAYGRAEGIANQGFTPGEAAGYQNKINQGNATSYSRAVGSAGGNLSNVISAGINSQDISSASDYATKDAGLRRQNMQYADSLASQIQNVQDMATKTNIDNRNRLLAGWNNAAQSGLQSFANSFSLGGVIKDATAIAAL